MPSSTLASAAGYLLCLILILVLAYFASRWVATRGAAGFRGIPAIGSSDQLRVVAQVPVGRSESLVLVYLQGKCYLLGVTASSISLITELEGDEAEAWMERTDTGSAPSFLSVFRANLRNRK